MKEFIKLAAATILYKEMKKMAVGALGTSSAFSGAPPGAAPARNPSGLGFAGQNQFNRIMGDMGMTGMGSMSTPPSTQPSRPAAGTSAPISMPYVTGGLTPASNSVATISATNPNARSSPTSLSQNELMTHSRQLQRGVTPAHNLLPAYDQSQARLNSGMAPPVYSDSQNKVIKQLRDRTTGVSSARDIGNMLASNVKGITGSGNFLSGPGGRVN